MKQQNIVLFDPLSTAARKALQSSKKALFAQKTLFQLFNAYIIEYQCFKHDLESIEKAI